jgi:hypothetical protein
MPPKVGQFVFLSGPHHMFRFLGIGLLAVGVFAASSTSSMAATQGSAPCVPNAQAVTPEQVSQFLANPQSLLTEFKEGQGGLASRVRDLLTTHPETLDSFGALAKASSEDQSRAIGAGAGTAASICVLTQQTFAELIAQAVLSTDNPALIHSYQTITGDVATEAINGGPAAGDDTAGGGFAKNTSRQEGGLGTFSTSSPYTFQTVSGNTPSSSNTTLFVTAGPSVLSPVSPSR